MGGGIVEELGLTFGGRRPPFNLRVIEKNIGRIAPIKRKQTTSPGLPGAMSNGYNTEVRTIKITMDFEGDSKQEWLEKLEVLTAWFIRKAPEPLIFEQEPGRMYLAEMDGDIETKEINIYGQATMTFICSNPYKYGKQETYDFIESINFFNQGTVSAIPIFTIYFLENMSNFQISVNGNTFRLIREFAAGDRVVIDCERQLVRLNDLDAMPIRDWRTPFKRLLMEPGENQVAADAGADVEVKFTERYL